jgi:hypothetical protein
MQEPTGPLLLPTEPGEPEVDSLGCQYRCLNAAYSDIYGAARCVWPSASCTRDHVVVLRGPIVRRDRHGLVIGIPETLKAIQEGGINHDHSRLALA